MGFFDKLKKGLAKTRFNVTNSVNQVFSSYDVVDDDFYEELEEIMIMSDMGVRTTDEIISNLKERVINENIQNTVEVKKLLMDTIKDQMRVNEADFAFEDQKSLILMIGVNGVGKTTTVGKLANLYRRQGKSVLIAAADTFRAGAAEQLTEWAKRAKVPIITGKDGGDPGAVVYDAIQAAKARDTDILIVDTAGRLHNKIVLDGTTGQNALMQAREFAEVTAITGIVLTKLDGTAKGGIAIAIQSELGFPVKYIGVGEQIDDMQRFDSDAFVDALFADDGNTSED